MDTKLVDTINELDKYIAFGRSRLRTILGKVNWTIDDSLKEISHSTANSKKEYIDRNDPLLPNSFGCKNSVFIDTFQLQTIINKKNVTIPEKFSDIQLNFTKLQKAKIYDYVIANTAKTSEPELKVSCPNDETQHSMTFAEIVAKAKKKDKKIQRKYRTSKPTHIEEVRNLVNLQMQALDKYFNLKPESNSTSTHDNITNYGKSGCRNSSDYLEQKSRSHNIDETFRYKFDHNQHNRQTDKKDDKVRSLNINRSDRLLKNPSSVHREKTHKRHKSTTPRKNDEIDEFSVAKDKTKRKTTKKSKKHKHSERYSNKVFEHK